MLYSDDLALTANNHTHMHAMSDKLRVYATRKCLTVNAQKNEVACFNFRTDRLPPLLYGVDSLPYTDHDVFKYLGMLK
eukprot:542983-Pelagomonas_calceolata.AAC.1